MSRPADVTRWELRLPRPERVVICGLLCVLFGRPMFAQSVADTAIRDTLRWSDHRDVADKVSTVMVAAAVVLPCVIDRTWTCVKKEAVHVGLSTALAEGLKLIVHRDRPNGVDNKSFFSMHTAIACSATYGTKVWEFCPAVGYMRIASDWHWGSDVGTGAFVGAAMTYVW